ncbi:hypothetical protein ABC383_28000 [Noviherbaspirillum sp. 1P10PC]|uniref:hypothetical protein n=1 Tax=Noviherbaspirillum sp. 1P10PC TaxID=3132292 RepID=UPI00399F65E4
MKKVFDIHENHFSLFQNCNFLEAMIYYLSLRDSCSALEDDMKSHFSLFLASGTFFLCGLLGCANPQKSPFGDADVVLENAADVGMVSVKAFPPLSFATIQSKLAPNIAITTEEARRDALSATMYDDVNYADRIKSILQLGLQNTTREQTTTSETGKENQTKTITSTSPGVLPEKADQDQVLAAALRTLTPPSIADAFLSYSSITGLKQYAGWLDNYLSGISIPDEYRRLYRENVNAPEKSFGGSLALARNAHPCGSIEVPPTIRKG